MPAKLDGRRLLRRCVERIETRSRFRESPDSSAGRIYPDRSGDYGTVLLVQRSLQGISKVEARASERGPALGGYRAIWDGDGSELGRAGALCQSEVGNSHPGNRS